jgi:hypothetical protein
MPSLNAKSNLTRLGSTAFSFILAAGLSGCGGASALEAEPLYVTRGKVELASGKPLSSGTIEFVPLRPRLSETIGDIESDGTFTIRTLDVDQHEGVSAGEYKVRIRPDSHTLVRRGDAVVVDRKRLPFHAKYLNEETSALTATVKPGLNELPPFRLTR